MIPGVPSVTIAMPVYSPNYNMMDLITIRDSVAALASKQPIALRRTFGNKFRHRIPLALSKKAGVTMVSAPAAT